jgi:hypothetical protein
MSRESSGLHEYMLHFSISSFNIDPANLDQHWSLVKVQLCVTVSKERFF